MSEIPDEQFAADLVEATMAGAYGEAAEALAELARPGSRVPGGVVKALVTRCADAVQAWYPAEPGSIFTVVVADEQARHVDVDCLPPGPLAALRALLAALGHDDAGRDIHVDLATRGRPEDVVRVVTHLLVWLVELADTSTAELPSLSCFAG